MLFSGTKSVYLPTISEFTFAIQNLTVNTYGAHQIRLIASDYTDSYQMTVYDGLVTKFGSATPIATYQTGIPFSISGFMDRNRFYYEVEGIANTGTRVNIAGIKVVTPAGTTCTADFDIKSNPITYSFNMDNDYAATGVLSGNIISNTSFIIHTGNIQYFQSNKDLLSGGALFIAVDSGIRTDLYLTDVDDANYNYQNDYAFHFAAPFGEINSRFQSDRTGVADGTITQFINLNTTNVFSGEFDGVWSGTKFIYDDTPQSITLNYGILKHDGMGNMQDVPFRAQVSSYDPQHGGIYTGAYITGFNLTTGGQYQQIPRALFSGYYSITGIQQAMSSLLFSSGCTGNIGVTYTRGNNYGSGASGSLSLTQVYLQDIYKSGVQPYYMASSYNILNAGTGYMLPARAVFNTGQYGTACFSVPNASGYDTSVFRRLDTSGAMNPTAAYLTGEVLWRTGVVPGGTGYIVTGLEVTNLGSGYNQFNYPYVSFIRQPGDILTSNASGVFSIKNTGVYNFTGYWTVETGFAGREFSIMPKTGVVFSGGGFLPRDSNYLSVRLTVSGLDNTQGIITQFNLITNNNVSFTDYITGMKYYSTDTGHLKKKNSLGTGVFAAGSELSFLVSQDELDEFYSTEGYTNNNWTFDLGDLDF